MVVELHFRKSDYEKYGGFFQRLDIVEQEDVQTTIDLPKGLSLVYNYLMKKLKNQKIILYSVTRKGGKDFYEELEPPHRNFILQRCLSQHLALNYWAKKVKLNEFDNLEKSFEKKPGSIFLRFANEIDLYTRKLSSTRRVRFIFNNSAVGIFSKPDVFGIPLFSRSFAFSYSLACYLVDSPLVYKSWRHWIEREFVAPMSRAINETTAKVKEFIQSLLEEPPSLTEMLYSYIKEHGEVNFSPVPPVDLIAEIQKYGYDAYDLQYAANDLYNNGLVDGESKIGPDGTRKFKTLWLKRG